MFYIYYATTFKEFLKILKAGAILKESQNSLEHSRTKGKLASNPKISLVDETFSETYDEVDGVYTKIFYQRNDVDHDVVLIFNPNVVLEKRCIVNTVENFGFAISENGKESISQFSGEPGVSFFIKSTFPDLKNFSFDPSKAEVVFLENLELGNLSKILVKKKFKSNLPTLAFKVEFI